MYQAPYDPSVAELRERVSELEAENAALRQLDDAMRRNIRFFEALLVHSQDAIVLVTPQLTFLKVVHSALGNSDQDLMGQSVLSAIHPEDAPQVRAALDRLLSGQESFVTCECRALGKKDEMWHWVEVEMTDLLNNPDVQAIVFNGRKIDKRKEYQAALEELEALRARQDDSTLNR